jgi:hypothetical protein
MAFSPVNSGQVERSDFFNTIGRLLTVAKGSSRPILLKKSGVLSKTKKYASEIKILNVRRPFQAEISRRRGLKMDFQRLVLLLSKKTTFSTESTHCGR